MSSKTELLISVFVFCFVGTFVFSTHAETLTYSNLERHCMHDDDTDGRSPECAIYHYYSAINCNDVQKACKFRMKCSKKTRDEVTNTYSSRLDYISKQPKTPSKVVVSTHSRKFLKKGGMEVHEVDWILIRKNGRWKIAADPFYFQPRMLLEPRKNFYASEPEIAVREYYKAIKNRDVDRACSLRTSCDKMVRNAVLAGADVVLDDVTGVDGSSSLIKTKSSIHDISEDTETWTWFITWKLEKDPKKGWLIKKMTKCRCVISYTHDGSSETVDCKHCNVTGSCIKAK